MSSSNPHVHSSTGQKTHHSKDDALDDVEYEKLLEGAASMRELYGNQGKFLILVAGRLGLRRGEIAHMSEEWIDWRRQMICIPRHEPCTDARDEDGPCGYCRQLAEQKVEIDPERDLRQMLEECWTPKTEAASREIYFGHEPRVAMYIERFFDEHDRWRWSSQAINRRIKRAAELAPDLDPADVRPHSLRATAATKMAAQGLEMHSLMQIMGWAKPQTAEVYIARNGENTARQLDATTTR